MVCVRAWAWEPNSCGACECPPSRTLPFDVSTGCRRTSHQDCAVTDAGVRSRCAHLGVPLVVVWALPFQLPAAAFKCCGIAPHLQHTPAQCTCRNSRPGALS